MTAQELEEIIQKMDTKEIGERKGRYLEFHMDFDVAEVEIITSLN